MFGRTGNWLVALFFGLSSAVPTTVRAQASTATVGGTVLDETGAVVPDVEIIVVNLGTALRRTTTNGDQGSFVVPLLTPGSYSLTVRHTGFTTAEIANLVLNVGDAIDLRIVL